MAGEWHRSTLGDYFTLQRGTTYKSRLLGQPGPVLLGLATIHRNGGFRSDSLRTYGGDSPDKLIVQPGELYVSLKDVTQSADLLGAVARLPLGHRAGRLTQDTVRLESRSDDVPLDYLYWLMRTPQYRSYCRAHATGTTNLGLAREDFLAFPAPEPSSAQRAIVQVLGTLDDKIELNRRTSRTLEKLARAIFRAWFVDFEPVKAKAAGARSFPGMPQEAFDALPTRLVQSELGPIPEGWSVGPLASACEIVGGGTPKRSEVSYWGGDISWYSVRDVPSDGEVWVIRTEESITRHGLENSAARLISAGGTIISARGTVGKLALTAQAMTFNQSCYGLLPTRHYGPYFLHLIVRHAVAELQQRTHGSVFDTITRETFERVQIVNPDKITGNVFEELIRSLFVAILQRVRENFTLATVRDYLLPKLLSGEVRVGDAEKIAGRHV